MKVSADKNSPYYTKLAHQYQVHLDGKRIDNCITADEEVGMVECYKKGDNGEYLREGDHIAREVIYGNVNVVYVEAEK